MHLGKVWEFTDWQRLSLYPTFDKGGEVEIYVKLMEESQDYPEPFSPNKLGTKKHQETFISAAKDRLRTRKLQGDFFHWYPTKKLNYGKPRLGESTLT